MLTFKPSRPVWDTLLLRCLVVGTLTATGICAGVVPSISHQSFGITFQNTAHAQNISPQEVTNFARALLEMEPLRLSTYNDIKRILGSSNIPNIVCSQPQSFGSLPGNARQIAINYCNSSREIARRYGFSTERFNQITAMVQSDPGLRKRIQDTMVQLQNSR